MTIRKPARLLLVDDDPGLLKLLGMRLISEGYSVVTAESGPEALRVLGREKVDLVISDLRMDEMDGLQLFSEIQKGHPGMPVIILTAHGSIPDAVAATQQGGFSFLTKPVDKDALYKAIDEALEQRSPATDEAWRQAIVTRSPLMLRLLEQAGMVAQSDVSVLINGQSGTGKEIVAQAIHNASPRHDKPFVAINCGALPEQLLESELFGHARGAFTGAVSNREGLFQAAEGGTLFLDEINSMPLFLQSKLLRVLQDGSFRSLGGSETKRTNVKIIAATNVEPLEAIEKGQLRRDIYYRLSMMSIRIPPLRERKADIGHFVKFYVNKHNGTFHKQVQYVSKDLLKKLEEYDWPGNVRELEHVIVYGMSMVDETSALLQYKDIKGKLLLEKQADRKKTPESLEEVPKLCSSLREAVAAYEEKLIWQALEAAHGNISEAARILDVPRQTLQRKASQLRGEKAKEKQEKEI